MVETHAAYKHMKGHSKWGFLRGKGYEKGLGRGVPPKKVFGKGEQRVHGRGSFGRLPPTPLAHSNASDTYVLIFNAKASPITVVRYIGLVPRLHFEERVPRPPFVGSTTLWLALPPPLNPPPPPHTLASNPTGQPQLHVVPRTPRCEPHDHLRMPPLQVRSTWLGSWPRIPKLMQIYPLLG